MDPVLVFLYEKIIAPVARQQILTLTNNTAREFDSGYPDEYFQNDTALEETGFFLSKKIVS